MSEITRILTRAQPGEVYAAEELLPVVYEELRKLVDRARERPARRRGGGLARVDLDAIESAAPQSDERLLAVNQALRRFERVDAVGAELVKLRCLVGLSMPEAAEALSRPQGRDRRGPGD